MPSWKRIFFKAAGFGAGFAVALSLVAGIWSWYRNRPRPEEPWNNKAISATFKNMDVSNGERVMVNLTYILHNNTDLDYKPGDGIRLMLKEKNGNLDEVHQKWIGWDAFIPAHHSATYAVTVPFGDAIDAAKAKESTQELQKFLFSQMHSVDAVVLFDSKNRYEIELPSGWDTLKAQ